MWPIPLFRPKTKNISPWRSAPRAFLLGILLHHIYKTNLIGIVHEDIFTAVFFAQPQILLIFPNQFLFGKVAVVQPLLDGAAIFANVIEVVFDIVPGQNQTAVSNLLQILGRKDLLPISGDIAALYD